MATLSAQQLSEYLTTARTVMTTGNYAAGMLIAYTSRRAREATALHWSDIDFERKRIDSDRDGRRILLLTVEGNIRRRHHLTRESVGLPSVTLHRLRHTHKVLLLEVGTHAKVIQERLGHADATLTMETYAHVLHTLQSDTAKQFEQLLKRKKTAQQSGS